MPYSIEPNTDTLTSLSQFYKYVKLIYLLKFRMNPLFTYSS